MTTRTSSALGRLAKLAAAYFAPGHRRVRLLASMLVFIFTLLLMILILVLLVEQPRNPPVAEYVALIFGLAAVFALAYGLNRKGHYVPAATLVVVCAALAPWGSVLLDPHILGGDLIPLAWVALSVLLSSILLPPGYAMVLAVLHPAGLGLLFAFNPATAAIADWPGLLMFVLGSSVLSVIFSIISQRDEAQIDRQTEILMASEMRSRELSIRDHLTALFNRRYLHETLERELKRAAREQQPVGLIMLDIDHFKALNDTLGHAVGDELLQALGNVLQADARGSDVACRYGGEEFVLVLPGASREATTQRAERLRADIGRLQVESAEDGLAHMTVSLGVAIFPENGSTGDAILKSADAALYRAKDEGRDRVVVATV